MGSYTFIAGMRDHNCILTNVHDDIETSDELMDLLTDDWYEAYEIFGSMWRIDYEDIDISDVETIEVAEDGSESDVYMTMLQFYEIADSVANDVQESYKLKNK